MGMAEVIPGVSGGTIAFITGIYERLINSIKSIDPRLFTEYKERGIKGVWKAIDGSFLLFLLGGMIIGIGVGVVLISHLLEKYPEPLWAFFFGLIIASCIYIAKKIKDWNLSSIVLIVIGAAVAFGITQLAPSEGSTHPVMLIAAGCIAISALILPGISGSFMLLLMGMYTIIIPTLRNLPSDPNSEGIKILFFFGIGAIIGLAVFSRILSWTFKHYENQTLAILTGFMIGSLNKIWPWRNPTHVMDKTSGQIMTDNVIQLLKNPTSTQVEYKILQEAKVLPSDYLMGDAHIALAILSGVLGFAMVFLLERFDKKSK